MGEAESLELPGEGTVPPLATAEEFAGKTALVTGGTDGLGRHLCGALISLGAEVFFCGRREARGRDLAAQWGSRAHFLRCDLADADDARAMVAAAGKPRGQLDYLVNNAGIDPDAPFEKIALDDFDRIVAIDLRAQFVVTQAAVDLLAAGTGRAIVNVCTTNWLHGWGGATAYNAAKAGIVGFSRSLARELGPRGIRVNVVSPGWIMTPRQLAEKVSEPAQADLLRTQCVKTLLTAQHVTPATLFLLSRAASGLSGQNLVVDGGKYFH
jgi:NAD(P)-dependent dehydrogenase (short-subunit alcohol dehydrogenase family)